MSDYEDGFENVDTTEDYYTEEDAAFWGEDFDEASFFDPDDEDEDTEYWEDACGYDPDTEKCQLVGSEHCSFWCPLHHIYFKQEGE